jgi:ATP-dependent Clp protease adaptor protein ClpS
MAERTIERVLPRTDENEVADPDRHCIVIVYDNPVNTWDQVILILQKATGCSLEEATNETWEIDTLGRSVVHHGDREECERAAAIIRTIGIDVVVDQV